MRILFLFLLFLSSSLPVQIRAEEADPPAILPQATLSRSLSQALEEAYRSNPVLRAAREELKAVHESLPQAQAGWKPTISADGNITAATIEGSNFGGADGATAKDIGIGFTQPVFRGFQTVSEIRGVRYLIQAQRALLLAAEQDIMLDAATAFMDVLRDRSLLGLSRNNRDIIARELDVSRGRFSAGAVTRTDVAQAEARVARADSEVIKTSGDLERSKARYEQVIGLKPEKMPVSMMFKYSVTLRMPEILEALLQLSEDQGPSIIAAKALHEAAKEDVEDTFGELLPSLELFGNWNRTFDPQPGLIKEATVKSIGLSMSVPLYEAGGVRSRVRQAKHTANQRFLEVLSARRQTRQDVISSFETLKTARSEIKSREAQVKASKIAREGVHKERDLGARTVLDVLDADQELLDAQSTLVIARHDEIVARFSLGSVLGALTPENLEFSELKFDYDAHLEVIQYKFLGMNVDILDHVSE